MFERWLWKEKEHVDQFVGESFLAIDPGESGKVLAYEKGNPAPVLCCGALEQVEMARLMRVTGARVLVYEQQYVRSLKASQSVLEMTFKFGMALGWVGCTRADVRELHLFGMAPASWQAHQRGHKGHPKRAELAAIAKQRALAEAAKGGPFRLWWDAEVKEGREGLASALGIADLWKHVAWHSSI